jgi:hypothetical protein
LFLPNVVIGYMANAAIGKNDSKACWRFDDL